MTKDQRRSVCGNRFFVFGLSSSVFRHSSNNKTRPSRPRTRSALAVPPWFAEASRPQPQWSTPTQPRNGRRRPGPTPNSTGKRKNALPPVGLSPAAQECLSEGAQAAFAAIAALWTAQSASYSLHQRFLGRCPNVAGRIPRGVRSVKTDFWPIQMSQARNPTPLGCRTTGLAHCQYLRLIQLDT
jgi:hypothetical protein